MRFCPSNLRAVVLFAILFILLSDISSGRAQSAASIPVPTDAPYKNRGLPVEQRVADLLKRMTLEEKGDDAFGLGVDGVGADRAAGDSGNQNGRWAHGCAVVGRQLGDYERGKSGGEGGDDIVPLRRRHGRHVGYGTRAARGPGDRAGSEGAGPRHDPGTDREHQPRSRCGGATSKATAKTPISPDSWASPTSRACKARA